MTTATLKCTHCKERFPRKQMIQINAGNFCNDRHISEYALAKAKKDKQKQIAKKMERKIRALEVELSQLKAKLNSPPNSAQP